MLFRLHFRDHPLTQLGFGPFFPGFPHFTDEPGFWRLALPAICNVRADISLSALPKSTKLRSSKVVQSRAFDRLIADLCADLVRATVDEIDQEINRWLRRIVLALGLDRSTVAEINGAGWGAFSHGWARDQNQIIRPLLDVNVLLPWVLKKVRAGETIAIPSLDDLPEEAAVDRESYRRHGTKSTVIIPICAGGEVVGGVGFATMYRERKWAPSIIKQLQLVAEIFGYALERKKTIREIRLLREELTHVTRVMTVGELAASIAHDLNQPLTAIMNDAEAARLFLAPDRLNLEAARVALKEIVSEDKRASEIIGRFRSLFKRRELGRSTLFMDDLFADVERIVKSRATMNNINLAFHIGPFIPSFAADRVLLQQVLINLILNAFDSVAAATESPRQVEVSAFSKESGFINFAVRDTGIGIDKDIIPRLFQSFVTTKPQGLGMGLAIARSIIDAHGGRLWAKQNVDRGACLEFILPAGDGPCDSTSTRGVSSVK